MQHSSCLQGGRTHWQRWTNRHPHVCKRTNKNGGIWGLLLSHVHLAAMRALLETSFKLWEWQDFSTNSMLMGLFRNYCLMSVKYFQWYLFSCCLMLCWAGMGNVLNEWKLSCFFILFYLFFFFRVPESAFSHISDKVTNILSACLLCSLFSLSGCLFVSCSCFCMLFLIFLVIDLWVVMILTKSPKHCETAAFAFF